MSRLLARPIESLRNQISELGSSRSSDEAATRMVETFKSVQQIFEDMNAAIESAETAIAEGESRVTTSHRKPLSESKCVSNLKILGSDKSEFKNWNEKFINALSQSLGRTWRTFMKKPQSSA